MAKDFVPESYKNLHDWANTYSNGVGAVATRISWPTASVTALKAQLTIIITLTQAILDAQAVLETAVGQLHTAKPGALSQVRLATKNLKATTGFTEGDAKALGVFTTPDTFDPNTYQPPLEATARHGYVELMAKKLGADSLNVYWRPAGTATWNLLSAKRARFPFHDDTPAPAGQTMQAREYMAMGVIADEEIGNPSNIASAVFQS